MHARTMSYASSAVPLVRQEGFQLPSPANSNASNSPSDPAPTSPPPDATPSAPFMQHNLSYVHDPFRKFPSATTQHHVHQNATPAPIDLADELASLIDSHPHMSSHERSTHSDSPTYEEAYRHNIFDISAPSSTHPHPHPHPHHPPSSSTHPFALPRSSSAADMYPSSADIPLQTHFNGTVPPLNSAIRFEPHPDPPVHLSFRHTPSPSHRSRSRSRAPSVGPARTAAARRDRRASSISSHVSSTSPPPRPHPHAIVIPGRGNASAAMGGFFVPGQSQSNNVAAAAMQGSEYSLPTPESLSRSFGYTSHHGNHIPNGGHVHAQFGAYATPSSPYYTYSSVPAPRPASPTSLGISPSDVDTLNGMGMGGGSVNVNGLNMSAMTPLGASGSVHPSSLPSSVGGMLSGGPIASGSHPMSSPNKTTVVNGTAAVVGTGPKPVEGGDGHLSEKRRKRRESHNAVERRRRDNINERITELAGLIPGVLFECDGMHVLPADGVDGLPDLPEENVNMGALKKDPAEDGEDGHVGLQGHPQGNGHTSSNSGVNAAHALSSSANGTIPTNGTTSAANGEQTTIKANKGMILRKSVEYIRYLQQLVSVQASRGRDLEERNRVLEGELAALRESLGDPQPSAEDAHVNAATVHGDSGNVEANSINDHGAPRLDGQYNWGGGDMDVEDVQRRSGQHQRSSSRYNTKLEHREALGRLEEVDLELEDEEERRGRQRERGLPERLGGMGRSVSRVRGGLCVGMGGGRENGDMEI
ncbi:hypothetical protein ID866_4580 [Astraeus odoratus]|nr:hypothetical protein ID866_4580 [Astraeus odoratus]